MRFKLSFLLLLVFSTIYTQKTKKLSTEITDSKVIHDDDIFRSYKRDHVSSSNNNFVKKLLYNNFFDNKITKDTAIQETHKKVYDIIKTAIANRVQNDPDKRFKTYSFKSYSKYTITNDEFYEKDSLSIETGTPHSFFYEKASCHQFHKSTGLKERVMATHMTGFEKPIFDILKINFQSTSLYKDIYTVFDNTYTGVLSNNALKYYNYKIIDTTKVNRPAFVIFLSPKREDKRVGLEGLLYLDTESLAIQKAVLQVRDVFSAKAEHHFKYNSEERIWVPSGLEVRLSSASNKHKLNLFGANISVGNLQDKKYDEFLIVHSDFYNYEFESKILIKRLAPVIEIDPEASSRSKSYWNEYRTKDITAKDQYSFPIIDSIVKSQKIRRKIDITKSFNIGYFPIKIFDFDLTYPIKYNNFEGLRLGIGGLTNEKFSKRFRLEGYFAYGFKDENIKYGFGGGILLQKKTGSWLNFNYSDDLKEVGSFSYLTDKRVYSLFEPRLVNIDFYYKQNTISSSLQHSITPKLLSELLFSVDDIKQTSGYSFDLQNSLFSSYTITSATLSLQWNPFSEYLQTPSQLVEIKPGYPKFTVQYNQAFDGVFDGDFKFHKIGVKADYVIKRPNQQKTSIYLEGNYASGDLPLTHLYHAYPNAPTKETILQRFSVAGRRSFETMFFNEFFSDRLATLQIKHQCKPLRLHKWVNPEFTLITKYAIGDVSDQNKHLGVAFNSLKHLYQESGFEINKILAGFGVSFAYRYGAYHLSNIEDNISFKFTFYMRI